VIVAGLRRLFAASASADFSHYLIHTAVAFKALRLGADPLQLGTMVAASTGAYAILVNISGRLSDRVSRMTLARASCIGVAAACVALTVANQVERMIWCMPLLGGSVAFFWPCVQASIADRSDAGTLGRNLGRFNLSWSAGKSAGFVVGGVLVASAGAEAVLTVGCLGVAIIFFLLPRPRTATAAGPIATLAARDAEEVLNAAAPPAELAGGASAGSLDAGATARSPDAGGASPFDPVLATRAILFRRLAWLANGAAYGIVATLTYHYPRLLTAQGSSARTFGIFLGGIYFTEMLVFAWLMRRPALWRFRRSALYLPQLLLAIAVAALPLADLPRLVLSAGVVGLGIAVCYTASIEYSLLVHEARGRNAGVHETLIGIGSMVVPLVGGIVARMTGSTWAPYLVAAGGMLAALAGQEILYRTQRTALPVTTPVVPRPDPDVIAPA
jgi:MFS family permease